MPATALLQQVRFLAEEGYKEVVYLGQTVNAYRDGECDFAELLRQTNLIEGIERIRFTSPHPADMSERIIAVMATCEKVSPYLHLPLQSASNRILKRMERGYTAQEYISLVDRLRRAIPGLALSTDIIVGFPGEEEEDFLATYNFIAKVRYDHAFMFQYSPREGTKAYKWGKTVAEEEKGKRLQEIIKLQEAISAQINGGLMGQTVEVLVEGPAKRQKGWQKGWLAGKTPQFKTAVFPGNGAKPGDLVQVRIASATAHTLFGEQPYTDASTSSIIS
jgi:tRNA-2-methylthio-N6-dimethylallyladenosine synthase